MVDIRKRSGPGQQSDIIKTLTNDLPIQIGQLRIKSVQKNRMDRYDKIGNFQSATIHTHQTVYHRTRKLTRNFRRIWETLCVNHTIRESSILDVNMI
jgi:hypothetical protein